MKNMRLFKVKYIPVTNFRPSRVLIHDMRFDRRVYIDYDHEFNNIFDMAQEWLYSNKFIKIDFMGECIDGYILATSDFEKQIS